MDLIKRKTYDKWEKKEETIGMEKFIEEKETLLVKIKRLNWIKRIKKSEWI